MSYNYSLILVGVEIFHSFLIKYLKLSFCLLSVSKFYLSVNN
jgi:hypothetical protein